MKEKLEQIKEFVGKLSSKTKKLIIAGAALLLVRTIKLPEKQFASILDTLALRSTMRQMISVVREE